MILSVVNFFELKTNLVLEDSSKQDNTSEKADDIQDNNDESENHESVLASSSALMRLQKLLFMYFIKAIHAFLMVR